MLTKTEQVWRHLLVEEGGGRSRYPSLATLASALSLGVSTVHKALQRPADIGAIKINPGGGLRLLDPTRLLLLWAGHRNPTKDLLAEVHVAMPAADAEQLLRPGRFVLGGFGAVVALQGGNSISDYDSVICYGDPRDLTGALRDTAGASTSITVLEPDPLLRRYGAVTPLAQAFADLFNTPGWAAARFVSSLTADLISADAA